MNTHAPSLAQQQHALLRALRGRPGATAADAAATPLLDLLDARHPQTARGLAAYRANGHALAERALSAAYPVVAALIGRDNFAPWRATCGSAIRRNAATWRNGATPCPVFSTPTHSWPMCPT